MKARIILFTLAWLALFSLGVGGVVAYFALYRAVELEEQSHAERTASILATKINIFLNAFKRSVDAMATLPQVVRLVDGKEHDLVGVNHVLADYCQALQGDICYVMNRAGDTLAASNWRESTSLVGKNYAFRPYFQKALAGESGFYAAMGVTTHVRGLYISSPVVGQDGVTTGVAVIKFSLSGIDKEFYDVPMPVILTDENGIIFAANREKWLFHTLNPLPPQRFKEIAESLKMGDKPLPVLGLTQINSRKHYAIGQEAERYRLGKESVPLLPGWHIYYLSILEEDSTTEALNRLGEYSLLVTLFVLAIAGGVWQLFRMGLQDIFQRQQAETALMDSRRLIQDVVDQQSEVVFRMQPDTTLTFYNNTFARLFNLPDNFLQTGGKLVGFLPRPEWQVLKNIIQQFTPQEPNHESQREMKLLDDRVWHFLTRYRAFFQEDGTLTAIQGVWSDITLLTQQEERIRILSRATEESPAIVVITDADGKIEYINNRFSKVTGYSRQEVIGKTPSLLKSGEVDQPVYENLWETILHGEIWRGELHNRRRDGTLYWVNVAIAPITAQNGTITHFVGVQEEITNQKQLAAELLQAKEMAEEANRVKGEFLANMSHEIRTPMNAIIGMTTLCMQTETTAKQRDYLEKIASSSRSLLGIINNILDFSKLESNYLQVESIPFSLSEVLDNLYSLITVSSNEKKLNFSIVGNQQVPELLRGDPLRLEQVLVNLCSNAVKFTEQGKVELQIVALEKREDWVHLGFSVKDTGIGMNEVERSRLFRPFSQGDVSTTRKYGGSGLGLAICHRLVGLMGGSIQVESTPRVGTTFFFDVPFALVEEGQALVGQTPRPVLETDWLSVLKGKRALLVEDNLLNQQVAIEFLEKAGMDVHCALQGEEAIIMVMAAPYDIVLMDVQMPVLDGLEATRRIRALDGFMVLPIIAMTANALDSDRERCLNAGMNDHIIKPVEPVRLYTVLCKWLGAGEEVVITPQPQEKRAKEHASVEHIPGIDWQSALDLLDDNEELLIKLLSKFVELHDKDGQIIRQALLTGDRDKAKRLSHSMKSVAGNMGAKELQKAATALEKALLQSEENCDSLVDEFSESLDRICQSIANWQNRSHPDDSMALSPMNESDADWRPLYLTLLDQLQHADLDALESSASLVPLLRGRVEEQKLNQVIQWIENFDYEQAERSLKSLMHKSQLIAEEEA